MRLPFASFVLAACFALGCQPDRERYPAPPPCTGSQCGTPNYAGGVATTGSGGGSQGGGGSAGTGGAAAKIDQQGTVHRINSADFVDTLGTIYNGAATVIALPSGGGTVSDDYGGTNGTTFDLKDIESGGTWFLVQDQTSGASGIISTFSYADLPVLSSFAIPVIDLGVLQNIASSLPSVAAKGVSGLAAQVILVVQRDGAPLKGIQVTGGSGSGEIAYDSGSSYSDSATSTGPAGTVIIFNAALAGTSAITLTDTSTNTSYKVDVEAAAGAATLVTVELP